LPYTAPLDALKVPDIQILANVSLGADDTMHIPAHTARVADMGGLATGVEAAAALNRGILMCGALAGDMIEGKT